uniref:Myosin motor domain-containing protein n=1 Tax=Megaselia scalaris TaxID=36166 RepID=T1GR94_MEGSC
MTPRGHFIEVQVTDGALYRTKIHCYFLDQTRVIRPLSNEKNYHIFYQMLAGLSREERTKLNLDGYSAVNLRYLQNGITSQDDEEDSSRFQAWKTCLGILGIPFLDVVRVLAAVLLLGNIQFIDGQGLEVEVKGETELNSVANLLGVQAQFLFRGLTTRTHNARGQLVKSICDANMSNMTRDCLAKALYCRTVATIVRRANSLKRLGSTLGTLSSDSNESVHNQGDAASHHASTIGESCRDEGIVCDAEVDYIDNVPCIDLISSLRTGLLSMLDTECSIRGTAESYVTKIKVQHTNSSRLEKSVNKMNDRHDPRIFTIQHFAGKVEYDATDFLDTNRDVVPDDLVAVFYKHTCNFGFATHLFGSELKALYNVENAPRGLSFRISPTSHTDLVNGDEQTLVHARPHFVRCIRSNSSEISGNFERASVVKQIRALQVLETVNLMSSGYPHRMRFKQFNSRYRMLAPFNVLSRLEEKAQENNSIILQYALGTKSAKLIEEFSNISLNYAMGKRHIFLSEGIRQHLEKLRAEIRSKSASLIQSVWRNWQLKKCGIIKPRLKDRTETELPTKVGKSINLTSGNAFKSPKVPNAQGTITRPRPQPIAGTPDPPDLNEKCDSKIIQQTCTMFGLDLVRFYFYILGMCEFLAPNEGIIDVPSGRFHLIDQVSSGS